MTAFRVWAPDLQRVELELRGVRHAMSREGEDFATDVPAAAGDDYGFIVGDRRLPDPRSPWQPQGVHEQSRVDDARAFTWTDHSWHGAPLGSAVIYELHVGTFSEEGTFDGVAGKLDHLQGLGVNAVELMPVAEFPGDRGWGYDGVDLYAPHHVYGGPQGLRRLVDACHARGIAVVLDVVYNHLGPDGNYLGCFGPYFTDRHRTPWGDAFNLDGPGSDGVRSFLLDNASHWLDEFHIDGLRLDAVHAIVDTSAVHLLEALVQRVRALEAASGRTRWVVAESDLNDPRIVRAAAAGGYGVDAQWSDDFHHALHALLTGERNGYYSDFGAVADVALALTSGYVYAGRYSRFRRRRQGRPATGLDATSFLGYMQNHDQVGNRALGERSGQLLSLEQQKIAAALVLCAPFVPLLFAGEEWGATTPFLYFSDHIDPELARAVSAGRRAEFAAFGWPEHEVADPQDPASFERSRLDWSQPQRPPHNELLEWYRRLIGLRRSLPSLNDPRFESVAVRHAESPPHLLMRRGAVTLACNFDSREVKVEKPRGAPLVTSGPDPVSSGTKTLLPPLSATIWFEG
jgi:maltooligosyltrehalose trehalohydrolase